MIFSIEGNVGAGKTSVLSVLKNIGFDVVPEPLEEYTEFQRTSLPYWNEIRHNPLVNLYENTKTDVAIAQLHFMKVSFKYFGDAINKHLANRSKKIVFFERCFQSTCQFIQLYKEQGMFTPFVHDYLCQYYDDNAPDLAVEVQQLYLFVDPKVCFERAIKRNREGEVKGLTLESLQMFDSILKKEYETKKLMAPDQVFKIDVDSNDMVADVVCKILLILKSEGLSTDPEQDD